MTALELGATLFIPASHKNLATIISAKKYPQLRSMVIDFEDGLDVKKQDEALQNLQQSLTHRKTNQIPFVFVRPANPTHLKTLLELDNISRVDGFVLPKFGLSNSPDYLNTLHNRSFYIMPSIEGSELFDKAQLIQLRTQLLEYKERIVAIRFGLEDMLRQLGMRRECEQSVFDFAVCSSVLGDFLAVFKPNGFDVSGGVYPCFQDTEGFIKDVKRDLREGLISKTIIHPAQIEPLHELYKVASKQLQEAKELLSKHEVVFAQNGKMAEQHTMQPWAYTIIKRATLYGVV